jgi:hypothetical protein
LKDYAFEIRGNGIGVGKNISVDEEAINLIVKLPSHLLKWNVSAKR